MAMHADLLSTTVYLAPRWSDGELVIAMGDKRHVGAIGRAEVLDFGHRLGVPARVAARHLDRLCADLPREAARLLDEYAQGATGHADPGEARLLRQVVHGPVADAVRALKP